MSVLYSVYIITDSHVIDYAYLTKNNVAACSHANFTYFCTTKHIDMIVCKISQNCQRKELSVEVRSLFSFL